jgi:hypothetical protein
MLHGDLVLQNKVPMRLITQYSVESSSQRVVSGIILEVLVECFPMRCRFLLMKVYASTMGQLIMLCPCRGSQLNMLLRPDFFCL